VKTKACFLFDICFGSGEVMKKEQKAKIKIQYNFTYPSYRLTSHKIHIFEFVSFHETNRALCFSLISTMPRSAPKPYDCLRRPWHTQIHQPIRGTLIQEIFRSTTLFPISFSSSYFSP